MNPSVRKYPRTMQEAFGPYASSDIEEPRRPVTVSDIVGLALCVAALVFLGWHVGTWVLGRLA